MRTLLCIVSVAAAVGATYVPFRYLHDYVRDGRPNDGPFPSSLKNAPYFCYQVPLRGPCTAMFIAWFFDVVRRDCMPFFYSGCGGNENRFVTKAACLHSCETKRRV